MATVNCLVTSILHSFVFHRKKKNTGLEKFEGELIMAEFSFLDELSL